MIYEGAKLFDELTVAIGVNPDKKTMFTVEERLQFLRDSTSKLPNVKVTHFGKDFLVDYAARIGVKYILRGIRNEVDLRFEQTMRQINSVQNPEISRRA